MSSLFRRSDKFEACIQEEISPLASFLMVESYRNGDLTRISYIIKACFHPWNSFQESKIQECGDILL